VSAFYDWKHHAITEVVMGEFRARHNALVEKLVDQAVNLTPGEIGETTGAIKAYRDVLNIALEDIEESHGS
jgi:hypothetical protein